MRRMMTNPRENLYQVWYIKPQDWNYVNHQVPGTKISNKCQYMGQAHDQHVMCMDHLSMDHVTHGPSEHGPSRSHGEALPRVLLDMGA